MKNEYSEGSTRQIHSVEGGIYFRQRPSPCCAGSPAAEIES